MDRRLVGAGVAAAMLVAGGCGSASKPLTEAAFAQKGNAICRNASAIGRRETLVAVAAMKRHDVATVNRLRDKIAATDRQGLAELRKLKPPKALQGQFARYMAIEQQVSDINAQYFAATKAGRTLPEAVRLRAHDLVHAGYAIRVALNLKDCTEY